MGELLGKWGCGEGYRGVLVEMGVRGRYRGKMGVWGRYRGEMGVRGGYGGL